MRFEELQAIWETQTERPVFSMNEIGLHMALYEQRERSRRKLFWGGYFPMYLMSSFMLVLLLFAFTAFYFKDNPNDFPMSAWDGVGFLLAAAGLAFTNVSLYMRRRKHEKEQNVFATSLREELDRGIAHLEFLYNDPRAWLRIIPFLIGAELLAWELGRWNGEATSWNMLLVTGSAVVFSVWASVGAQRKAMKDLLVPRRRALEDLRAKLDAAPE